MRITLGLLLLLVSVCGAQTTSDKIRLTPEQAISVRRMHDLRFSPDGMRLAFTVSEPARGSEHQSHVWIFFPATHELRQFTNSGKSESRPRWSPDGKKLGFLSEKDDYKQILIMPTDGGEALPFTEGKKSVDDFEWSPDGKRIAFLARDPKTDEEESAAALVVISLPPTIIGNTAPVAQLDRVTASEAVGCAFEPRRAHSPSTRAPQAARANLSCSSSR